MSRNSANGSTREWRKLRAAKLKADPFCQWPMTIELAYPVAGELNRVSGVCSAFAVEVDHIIPLKDGGERFAMSNLRSLCADHHKMRHGKRPKPTVDPKTGLPTDNHWWAADVRIDRSPLPYWRNHQETQDGDE